MKAVEASANTSQSTGDKLNKQLREQMTRIIELNMMLKTKMAYSKEQQHQIDQLTLERDAFQHEATRLNNEVKQNTLKFFIEKGKIQSKVA